MKRRQRHERKPDTSSTASRTLDRVVPSRTAALVRKSRSVCRETRFDELLKEVARVQEEPRDQMHALPQVGTVVEGGYRIDRHVGCGGMGAVFAATHTKTGTRYALKWILPNIARESDVLARFERECRAGLSIRHPNVVQAYGIGHCAGLPFLILEWVQGPSLQTRLRSGAVPLHQALRWFLPIAKGVTAAHRAGFLHRDLKPDNVLLARGPRGEEVPKILDFGLTKPLTASDDLGTITRRDLVLGTPAFTAPEQLLGDAVDERADVYSLGVLLYTMLAGRRPFEANSYNQLLFKIATDEVTPLSELRPGLSATLDTVVGRAIAREREHRFRTVAEFAESLRPLQDVSPSSPFARAG